MKRFYFLAVFLWSIYFAVFPVLLDAAVSKSKAESNAHYATYYNDGAKLAQTILTQISNSIGENVLINSINRIASEMQNMGGLKSLQSEAFKQVFIDEVKNLTNKLASSLDEETLQAISSSSIYKMLSDLMNNAQLKDYFKKVSSKNKGGIGIGKDVQQGSFSSILSTITSTINNILSTLMGGSAAATVGAGSVASDALVGAGLLGVDGLDALTDIVSFFGSVIAGTAPGALADLGLLGEDLITDTLGDLGSIAGAEGVDLLEVLALDFTDFVNGFMTIPGATFFGLGSGFLFGTVSSLLGRALATPIVFALLPLIEIPLALVDGVFMAIVGGIAGLAAGVIGFVITHFFELIYDLVPGLEYNTTFWTVGGAGIVAAVATILGDIAGALIGAESSLPLPLPFVGNPISSTIIGGLLGATSGMLMGFGIGLIALSGA